MLCSEHIECSISCLSCWEQIRTHRKQQKTCLVWGREGFQGTLKEIKSSSFEQILERQLVRQMLNVTSKETKKVTLKEQITKKFVKVTSKDEFEDRLVSLSVSTFL